MPTLKKLLSKFGGEERRILDSLITKIISLDWKNLDLKKLKGYKDIYRLRKGKLRIIFTKNKTAISFFMIDRKSDTTYNL